MGNDGAAEYASTTESAASRCSPPGRSSRISRPCPKRERTQAPPAQRRQQTGSGAIADYLSVEQPVPNTVMLVTEGAIAAPLREAAVLHGVR